MTSAATAPDPSALDLLERYYDTAPRATGDVEEHGSLTLFVARSGFPFYARPRLGLTGDVATDDVTAVLERERELGIPRALEWVGETTPSLLSAAVAAGMRVEQCPLLVLQGAPASTDSPVEVRILGADDPDIAAVWASIHVGFGTPGTAVDVASVDERDVEAAQNSATVARVSANIRAGRNVLAGAYDPAAGSVGGGSHNPRGEVSEIAGVGVLPAFRRRGVAAALTAALAGDALDHGVTTVFCSAQDDDVARVYESVGFVRVGTACIAEAD